MTCNNEQTPKQPKPRKGKAYAGHRTGKRRENDYYQTPYSVTRQLCEREPLSGLLLEPACGAGAIVKVLVDSGYDVRYFDMEQDGVDFLTWSWRGELVLDYCDTVITNPPYSLALEFILRAKQVARSKICMLLPLSYLHGDERYRVVWQDREFPLARVWVFTRYVMFGGEIRDDGKYGTGMMAFAWFVWERGWVGDPVVKWIDNNEWVLRAGE